MIISNNISMREIQSKKEVDLIKNVVDNQSNKNIKPVNISDTLELSDEALALREEDIEMSESLNAPGEITITIPRAWTIVGETAEAKSKFTKYMLKKADDLNIPFGERTSFYAEERQKFEEYMSKNDPEMYTEYIIQKFS